MALDDPQLTNAPPFGARCAGAARDMILYARDRGVVQPGGLAELGG